jgi:hypothetical protein
MRIFLTKSVMNFYNKKIFVLENFAFFANSNDISQPGSQQKIIPAR